MYWIISSGNYNQGRDRKIFCKIKFFFTKSDLHNKWSNPLTLSIFVDILVSRLIINPERK